ncbi:hypothetical protein [Exiguobacterium artemiae]
MLKRWNEDAFRANLSGRPDLRINRDRYEGRTRLLGKIRTKLLLSGERGQPADRGTLNGVSVLDVQLQEGDVWHLLDSPLLENEVQGEVDDVIRTDHAAQHTAQHVISAILQDEFQIKTVSFRTGTEESTLDLDLGDWDETLQSRLEERLRTVIQANLLITATEYTEEEALQLPLRKTPQVTGKIRVVQIGELDYSACGGTHLASTSELELILFTGLEKVRGNIRLAYVAKDRAFRLLTTERRVLTETARAVSAKKIRSILLWKT